jgi:hypothetical protein
MKAKIQEEQETEACVTLGSVCQRERQYTVAEGMNRIKLRLLQLGYQSRGTIYSIQ